MSEINALLGENPVAIVGMSSVFADSKNIEEYWEHIIQGIDCISEVPDSRWSIADYYDPDPTKPDKTYCKVGGFLPDINFNPMEFGLPPNILEVTDASQLLALLVARDALIDAGYTPGSDKFSSQIKEKTGVILGVGGGQKLITPLTSRLQYPVWEKALRSSNIPEDEIGPIIEKMKTAYIPWNENSFPGMLGNVISGRVANRFDLGGINSVVDAACAASLSAIKMAVSELIEGRCDMMLTGGVDTDNSPFMYMSFSKTPAFSQKGSIRPFDHESDGMLIGEGVGMIVCKRLEDAVRDGDRIYATINGIGSSSDGRFKSVYAPRPKGQALAMQRAYDESGYDASTIGLVEAHGTGTGAGDPSEGESMKMVFGKNNDSLNHIALGSVKSQIGHTKAAAGVAGMIKAALALHNKVLPGTINVTKPNPKLNIEESPLYVNSESRPWFRKSPEIPRRASVSAFGFGGVNLHIAMEEFSEEQQVKYRTHNIYKIILINSADDEALIVKCEQHINGLQNEDGKDYLAKISVASQSNSIPKKNARLGFIALNVNEAIEKLTLSIQLLQEKKKEKTWDHPIKGIWYRKSAYSTKGKVVALFSGQGSQYVNMGKELAMAYPSFRNAFCKSNIPFKDTGENQLTDTVFPIPVFTDEERKGQVTYLTQTQLAQPAIGAMSTGMYRLLENAGFAADFYAGHSFGELTSLWAAGVMDDETFYFLAKKRGESMASSSKGDSGSMLAVQTDIKTLKPLIKSFKDVQVANINSSSQVILGGATKSIEKLAKALSTKGFIAKILPVSAAFHTPFVAHAHKPFSAHINKAKFKTTAKKVFSNTDGKPYVNKVSSYRSILSKHMLNTVLFKDQIENIHKDGGRIFIEFGPKNILSKLVKDILKEKEHISIALNNNNKKDSDLQIREALVQIIVLGIELQNFDTFRKEYKEPIPKGNMDVKISGYNYVSEPTKQKHTKAMSHTNKNPVTALNDNKNKESTINEEESEMTKQDRERLDKLHTDLENLKEQQGKVEQLLQQLVNVQQAALAPFVHQTAPMSQPIVTNSAPKTQPVSTPTAKIAPTPSEEKPDNNPTTATSNVSIEKTLLEVIAEKTGYPAEMLELNMDMEADLGIDSIKRVEIFGAMTESNPSVQGVNPQELAELRTLQQIVDYITEKAGSLSTGDQQNADLKKKENQASQEDQQISKKQKTPDKESETAPKVGKYPNVPRAGVILKYIPGPDTLEIKFGKNDISLITNDGTTVTTELCSALIARGHQITVLTFPENIIRPGKQKLPKGVKEIRLKNTSDSTIASAISSLKGSVSQFIHVHPHFRFPLGKLSMQFEKEKALIKSTYLLAKHLKASLNRDTGQQRKSFLIVTRMDGAMGMKNPGNVSVFGGGLFGLTKCLNLEWEKVFCRGTDIDPRLDAKYTAQKICSELFDADQCLTDTCYNHKGKRYTLLAKPMANIKKGQITKTTITKDSVFLVTGGDRGITSDCIKQMAISFKCKFILIGRSKLQAKEPGWAIGVKGENNLKRAAMESLKTAGEKPLPRIIQNMVGGVMAQREIEANLKFIKREGAQVEYVAANITNTEALNTAIKKGTDKLGNITGIIHGAGRLADKFIENKTEDDFDSVFDVKIKGLLAITQSINIENIEHVVLFSSVAGFYGNVGQTDYAIANETLNRMAHLFKKNHPNIHIVSINWGAWDSGMVSPELKNIFKENNISLVPTDEGPLAMVDQLSNIYANQQQVILGGTLPSAKAATDGTLNTYVMHRTLLESENPFLQHHKIQGNAVLPIINASTWMAQSAADLYPGFHLTRAEDVKLFNGIVFDGKQKDEYLTKIVEIEKSEDKIKVEVTITSENGTKLPTNHYRAIITLTSKRIVAPSIELPDINSFNPVEPNASIIYEDGTLFHGDDFRGVKQILELNKEGTLLYCEHEGVDPNRQGQFPVKELNVFLTDVMYQSLLIWIRRYHDCASLPLSTEAVEIYKVLPFARPFFVSLKVISSDDFGMEADITAFDAETGQVYMISRKARVTMSKDLQWA